MKVIGAAVTLRRDFSETVGAVRESLAQQGFGVLTEIDVRATLHAKIGVDLEPYLILGVCNPTLAHEALTIDRSVGVLLPCTVVVRAGRAGETVVEAQDPSLMAELTGRPELAAVAHEAAGRLAAAVSCLTESDAA